MSDISPRTSMEYGHLLNESISEEGSINQREKPSHGFLGHWNARKILSVSLIINVALLFVLAGYKQSAAPALPTTAAGKLACNKSVDSFALYEAIPPVNVQFHAAELFQRPPNPETNAAWKDLLGETDGVVALPKAMVEAANLPPSVPHETKPDHFMFGLGVFHEIHCLNMIRRSYWREDFFPSHVSRAWIDKSVLHCIDSLRQAILCHADTTLIPWWSPDFDLVNPDGSRPYDTMSVEDKMNSSFVYWEQVYQCRSFEGVKKWVAQHQA